MSQRESNEIITEGRVGLSAVLVVFGVVVGRMLHKPFAPFIIYLNGFGKEYGILLFILAIGVPLAISNMLEAKYVWGRILKNEKVDLLGVSTGLAVGIISLYLI